MGSDRQPPLQACFNGRDIDRAYRPELKTSDFVRSLLHALSRYTDRQLRADISVYSSQPLISLVVLHMAMIVGMSVH